MIDILTEKLQQHTEKTVWAVESFNQRTGNNCKDFRPNRLNNEVII